MASAAQTVANRSNAQKSTGPRTAEGKAVVAQNAVKHGLLARAAVLQGEDWEEYTCYHEEMLEELYPDGLQEMELAERIVSLSWRLGRAARYQNAVFEALYDQHAAVPAEPSARPDPGASIPSDPVLGRMLLADFSGARVLERVLLYERRIESSLCRVRAELRQLRRQPQTAAKRGAASFEGRWEDSGGYSHASPVASADFTVETANSLLAAEDPLCETKPISEEVSSVECQVSSEPSQASSPPNLPTSDFLLQASDSPSGVTTNAAEAEEQARETKPIGGGIGVQGSGGSDLTPDPRPLTSERSCETKPIEEVSSLKWEVASKRDRVSSPPSLSTSDFTLDTAAEPSCETKPIPPGFHVGQVLYGTEIMANSVPDGLGENKANSREQGACKPVVRPAGGPTTPLLCRLHTGV